MTHPIMPDPAPGSGRFNLTAWALEHRSFTGYLIFAFLLAGIGVYAKLGQKEDPDFTFRGMVVTTYWPGATAREMELQVTDRIERKLQETPYLDNLRSYSRAGESTIFVNLAESTPPKAVGDIWLQVRKKVADIRYTLPQEALGPFFNDEFGDTFGSIYAFSADGYTYAELKEYVDRARLELLGIPGVAKVELLGVQDEKIYIEYSNAKVAQVGIDPQVFALIGQQQNAKESSGTVTTPTDNVNLRVSGDFDSLDAIRKLSIRANDKTFRLGDIAEVRRGYLDPPQLKVRFQGKEVIGVAISMTKDGDVIKLGSALKEGIRKLRAEFPVGIEIQQVSDQPAVVQRSVSEFMRTLTEAIVIVMAVSFLSLGLRSGLVVALTVPLVLAITFLTMYIAGIDIHRISLGALIIALGLLVDDAMIAVEMMLRKLEEGYDKLKAASFAYESTAFPMLTGTLITATGFLPIGTAKSAGGEYMFSIFAVVGIALVTSWVAAVMFTPYIATLLLKQGSHQAEGAYQSRFYRGFRVLVEWCLAQRGTVIMATLLLFALSIYGFRFIDKQFFPSASRPELVIDLWLAEGSSFQRTEAQAVRLEKILLADADVANVVTYVGGGSPRFYLPLNVQLNNLNFAQMVVMAKGLEERQRLSDRLQRLLREEFADMRTRVSPLENGPPIGYPVQFRIVGKDPEVLRTIGQQVAQVMAGNASVRDVNFDWNERVKVMRLDVDQDKARALGLNSLAISRAMRAAVSGQVVGQFRESNKLIDIVVRARPEERNALSAIQNLSIHTQNGRFVPVSQVARLTQEFDEPIVWRRNLYPILTVRADVVEGAQGPAVTYQIDPLLAPLRAKLPDGYRIEIAGALAESSTAEDSVAAGIPLMLFIIFTLLIVQLQSVSRAVLVFLTAPLGLIGVALALLALHVPFGFVAQLGVIALGGMIIRNSVILIDQIEHDVRQGVDAWTATVEAAVSRLRPIALTAAAAVLAMIPLTRSAFWGPMAVAIMGGLIIATVLTLLFLPALYAAVFRIKRRQTA